MKNLNAINKRIFLTITCSLLVFGILFAQQNDQKQKSDFWNHVRFGGGIGLNFGDGFFSGTLAPSAIYQFDPQFALGLGLSASYFKREDLFKSTVLGGSVIGLFNPIDALQLSTEFEQLHVNRDFDQDFVTNLDDKYWYPALFLGAGYRSGNFAFGIRYDVLYDEDKSIYADPWMPFMRFYF